MDDIRYSGNLQCEITQPGYVSVVRNENFTFSYKDGKKNFSVIFVTRGELEYVFAHENAPLLIRSYAHLNDSARSSRSPGTGSYRKRCRFCRSSLSERT